MRAEKVKVVITVEALSIDTLNSLLSAVVTQVKCEAENGLLRMADGDQVDWTTTRTAVEF